MSVIAHVYQTTSNDNGTARSHPTNSSTSLPRFESGEQMHRVFQNHERDILTSSQCHQSRRGSTAWNIVDNQTVETPRPFCPHGHGSTMMHATPQQSLYWECSTCSTTSGLTVPLNVQGQLKDVDQELCPQLICESGQALRTRLRPLESCRDRKWNRDNK